MNGSVPFGQIQPPLQLAWVSSETLAAAVAGEAAVYGITNAGKVVALDPATGNVRWATTGTYLRQNLTVNGSRLYCYKKDAGVALLVDQGNSYTETLLVAVSPFSEADPVSNILVEQDHLYLVMNEALLVLTTAGNFVAGTEVGNQYPHQICLVGSGQCVVVDGYGQPQLFQLTGNTLSRKFYTTLPDPGNAQKKRAVLAAAGVLLVGANGKTIGYDQMTGDIQWATTQFVAEAFVQTPNGVFAVAASGHVWALAATNGAVSWRRMYLYATTQTERVGIAASNGYLFVAAFVANGGPIHMFALDEATGGFVWQANSTSLTYGAGMPLVYGNTLISYGTGGGAAAMTSVASPQVAASDFTWQPTPLRGRKSGFGGSLTADLPSGVTVTISSFREADGVGARLVTRGSWQGSRTFDWDAGGNMGFTDNCQFGRFLIDVVEAGGASYTVTKLVPVNTLPDLLGHWAQSNIETMIYKQFIGGYPDLTFRPDNLVTRAETSSIIAKTLGLTGPTPGFQTKFTDIGSHWARNAIMALEERGIINGFLENDGTYTFQPERSMTRGQEAKILVHAYGIPSAPAGFQTRFTDIATHWSRPDVEALEAAGYVNGFRAPDGSYEYRPDQNLSRAELCTLVVRIRNLHRD